jgi:hypothetical protein
MQPAFWLRSLKEFVEGVQQSIAQFEGRSMLHNRIVDFIKSNINLRNLRFPTDLEAGWDWTRYTFCGSIEEMIIDEIESNNRNLVKMLYKFPVVSQLTRSVSNQLNTSTVNNKD